MTDESKSIESLQHELRVVEPPERVRERAYFKSMEEYQAEYDRSIADPEGYWGEKADEFLSLDGEDHWMSRETTRLKILQASVGWVERFNPVN